MRCFTNEVCHAPADHSLGIVVNLIDETSAVPIWCVWIQQQQLVPTIPTAGDAGDAGD